MLTVLAGAVMVAAGLLRLGRYTRFVSFSVMIGFLTGVAVNIVLGQIPDFTGASAEGGVALQKAPAIASALGRVLAMLTRLHSAVTQPPSVADTVPGRQGTGSSSPGRQVLSKKDCSGL